MEAGVTTTSVHTGEGEGANVSTVALLGNLEHKAHIFPIPQSVFFPRQPTHPSISHVKEGVPQSLICQSVSLYKLI